VPPVPPRGEVPGRDLGVFIHRLLACDCFEDCWYQTRSRDHGSLDTPIAWRRSLGLCFPNFQSGAQPPRRPLAAGSCWSTSAGSTPVGTTSGTAGQEGLRSSRRRATPRRAATVPQRPERERVLGPRDRAVGRSAARASWSRCCRVREATRTGFAPAPTSRRCAAINRTGTTG